MKDIKSRRTITFLTTLAVILSVTTGVLSGSGKALSGSDFQAGRIIDDGVFFNSDTMTAGDIQNFLNSKVPVCDTNGTQTSEFGGGTRAQYGTSQGYPPPYICLKDYSQTIPSMGPDSFCPGSITAGTKSAAQIIKDVSVACSINPEVMLVLLQKEQGLVTDDWPFSIQYDKATGYACPDTSPCDPTYAGFFNQVYYGARQYQRYAKQANLFNFQAGQTENVYYNPNASCGYSPVNIQTQATAGLYNYTPYQPNVAALNNLYGSGDSCSAYGNRNFWRQFNDWFGSTLASPSAWQYISQETFADSARTLPVDPSVLAPNTTYYLRLKARNMSPTFWNSGTLNLATSNPGDRKSVFCDASWLNFPDPCNRAGTIKETSVSPTSIATFEFSVKTPATLGTYNEYFRPIIEGQRWLDDQGLYWSFGVKPPTYAWNLVSQTTYSDSARTIPINPSIMSPNTTYYVQLKARNTGNTTWTNTGPNPVRLGTSNPIDRASLFCDSSWLSCNRPAALQEASVAPGDVGTFAFSIKTPNSYQNYKEDFRLVAEGAAWMNDIGLYWAWNVKPPTYNWQYVSQAVYTDSSKTAVADTSSVVNASRLYMVIKARNTGNTTWTNTGPNPVRLGTSNPIDRASLFCDSSWLSCNRPAALQEASVAPGDVGTFAFFVKAPYAVNGTTYTEYYRPLSEAAMWMNDQGMYQQFSMNSTSYSWQYVDQSAFIDSARTQTANLSSAKINATYYLRLRARNVGGVTWKQGVVNLGTNNPPDRISQFCDSSWLSCNRPAKFKEIAVAPGDIGTYEFSVKTPGSSGTYNEYFRPVADGITWLEDVGQYWGFTVSP